MVVREGEKMLLSSERLPATCGKRGRRRGHRREAFLTRWTAHCLHPSNKLLQAIKCCHCCDCCPIEDPGWRKE